MARCEVRFSTPTELLHDCCQPSIRGVPVKTDVRVGTATPRGRGTPRTIPLLPPNGSSLKNQVKTYFSSPSTASHHLIIPYTRRNELLFYSPQGHHAAFALPPVALRELAKPGPSLQETAADLEEIMAYGEESEDVGTDTKPFRHRWEPDVRARASRMRVALLEDLGTAWSRTTARSFDSTEPL